MRIFDFFSNSVSALKNSAFEYIIIQMSKGNNVLNEIKKENINIVRDDIDDFEKVN